MPASEQIPAAEKIRTEIAQLTREQKAALRYSWKFYARPEQLSPPGDWQFWAYIAGRGAGKTRTGAEWVRQKVKEGYRRIALVAPTHDDFHKVMVSGESGILNICPPWDRPEYNEGKKELVWPNGAKAFGYSAEKPSRLRGPQHDAAWCDEIAAWHGKKQPKPGEISRRQETWDMMLLGLRLGDNPQCFVSTTPMPVDVIADLIKKGLDREDEAHVITQGSTYANKANLAGKFFQSVIKKFEGTRLGRQELLGELLEDVPGALWTFDMIAAGRVEIAPATLRRVVVAVDPSGAANVSDAGADEIGIVVAAEGSDGEYYVLADRTIKGSPQAWARAAVTAYHDFRADKIVAERNFGGEMVRHTIQAQDANLKVDLVTASRGKAVRAEPIALLYEQGRVHHVDVFGELEDQMIRMTAGGYIGDRSPDRLDALVWALSDLSQTEQVQFLGVY